MPGSSMAGSSAASLAARAGVEYKPPFESANTSSSIWRIFSSPSWVARSGWEYWRCSACSSSNAASCASSSSGGSMWKLLWVPMTWISLSFRSSSATTPVVVVAPFAAVVPAGSGSLLPLHPASPATTTARAPSSARVPTVAFPMGPVLPAAPAQRPETGAHPGQITRSLRGCPEGSTSC